jgi:tetratricopeptide (TPR) repeat protein
MRISYDLARAGDPVGAMDLVAAGLEVDAENADLWDQFGGFAFRAGQDAQAAYRAANPEAVDLAPEAAQHFRQATDAYGRVFAARGADTPTDRLRNVLRAYLQLGEAQTAVDAAARFLDAHPEDATLWSLQADALFRLERLEDAMASLDAALEIDPEYPNAGLRQASWLMQARMVDDALVKLAELARVSEEQADQAARMAWNEGYVNGYETEDYAYAVRIMLAAEQFANLSDGMLDQLRFWHGHSLLHATIPEQEALTPETAEATLPKFQEALRLVMASGDYASTVGMDLQTQVVAPIQQYIDIQEAIIRRGAERRG